ncbi:NADPH-dependent FMN reductase [Hyalangium sp.]|uniref:NADPH-dependent FMN reductase n=1 Tax=Hyalangium sp. TaxID=2028555 RepID=UPI002D663878|nr:NADPH-dependent FMN reductase [Hyalangium sp.]HYH98397.1 NADPH-dependent FMN reductase [Hyalangium sp.]
MKILAISGSLRSVSKNTVLLRAVTSLAPQGVEITLYGGMGEIPLFNPDLDDLDHGKAPASVLDFRAQLQAADGVFICTPEYAHGVSGVMKNALDWLVGSGEFMQKPTVLFNAAPGSEHAHPALLETLRTMGALVTDATLPSPLPGKKLDEAGLLAIPAVADALRTAIKDLLHAIETRPAQEF